MKQLKVKFEKLNNPYLSNESLELEAWGAIRFYLIDDSNEIIELLNWQWNVLCIFDWYINNKEYIFGTTLTEKKEDESIAEALQRLRDVDFGDDEEDDEFEWYSNLFNFWEKHSLRSALQGADIPDIIIGRSQNFGEISLSDDNIKWAYRFDICDFTLQFESELEKFIREWRGSESSGFAEEWEKRVQLAFRK